MSHKQNDAWLEAAKENFDEAVSLGNWSLAQNVIDDCRDNGFTDEAETLRKKLNHERFGDQ